MTTEKPKELIALESELNVLEEGDEENEISNNSIQFDDNESVNTRRTTEK